jgi:hypothetical protein
MKGVETTVGIRNVKTNILRAIPLAQVSVRVVKY